MNANELRVGNWYSQFGNLHQVTWDTIKALGDAPETQLWCKPIPLSPEILEKCGFYKFNNAWKLVSDKNKGYTTWIFTIWDNDGEYSYNSAEFNPVLTSLHQLQNLYFSLCGEELTYKQ